MTKLVNVFIADKVNRKFLAVKRSSRDKLFGGMWVLPGGKIEKGETPFKAAFREITEETGMKLTRLAKTPIITSKLNIGYYQAEIEVYKGEVEGSRLSPQDSDIQEAAWVSSSDLLASLKEFKYPDREIKKMETFLKKFFAEKG